MFDDIPLEHQDFYDKLFSIYTFAKLTNLEYDTAQTEMRNILYIYAKNLTIEISVTYNSYLYTKVIYNPPYIKNTSSVGFTGKMINYDVFLERTLEFVKEIAL